MTRRLFVAMLALGLLWAGLAQAGQLYDSFGAQSPKIMQSNDTVATEWDEAVGAKKVTQSTLTSCEDKINSICRVESQWEYEDVAASQTDQVIGATGAIGDLLHAVKCVTSAASVGAVTIKDGSGSAFTLFLAQGAAAILDTPALDWASSSGAWKLTTGTNTTCRVSGRFN